MAIKDFHCSFEDASGINAEISARAGVAFPDVHSDAAMMARLAIAVKEYENAPFCTLPFCHTVEAESMGGIVNLGDEAAGPRCGGYITESVEDLLNLPDIDFTKGRIAEVLKAIEILSGQGEHVVIEVCGPITIMNQLIDPRHIFKMLRKDPELTAAVFNKIGEQAFRCMEAAKAHGAQFVSYADVVGSVNILGPKMAESVANDFTYGFVKRLQELSDENCLVMLCPKTTFALIGTDHAEFRDVQLSGPMRYGEALIERLGKTKLAGMACCKNIELTLGNGTFKEVVLT